MEADSVKDSYLKVSVFDGAEEWESERRSSEAFLFVELILGESVETFILVDSFDESVGFKSETTGTCSCDEVNLRDNVEINGFDEWNNEVVEVDSVEDSYLKVNVFDGAEERTSERRSSKAFLFVELIVGDSVEALTLVNSFDESVGFKSETTDTRSCDEVNLRGNIEINGFDEWNNVVVEVDSVEDSYLKVNLFDGAEERTSERRSSKAFLFVELILGDSVETFILVDSFDESAGFKSETNDTCSCDEVNLCDNVEVWMLGRSSPDRTLVGLVFGGNYEATDLEVVVDADTCFCHEVDVCDFTDEQLLERGPIDEILSSGHVVTGGVEVVILKKKLNVVVA